jgi:uncharacterized Zn finger protein
MAAQAKFSAALLAGEMPQEIDAVFHAAGASLFPKQRAELKANCSCPDDGDPCKHVAATHYVLGEALDRDPFLLFELRGRSKSQVLDALRAARVETVIDVRDLPNSRRPGFSKRQLQAAVEEAGLRYVHLKGLGTPKEGRVANKRRDWDRFWHIVERRMATPEAEFDLQRAGEIARDSPSCLLCYEADHRICHRHRVAEELARRYGFTPRHLSIWPPTATP